MRRLCCIGTAKESRNANQNWVICVRLDEHSAHPDNRKYSAGHSRYRAVITPRHNRWLRLSRDIRRSARRSAAGVGCLNCILNRTFCAFVKSGGRRPATPSAQCSPGVHGWVREVQGRLPG